MPPPPKLAPPVRASSLVERPRPEAPPGPAPGLFRRNSLPRLASAILLRLRGQADCDGAASSPGRRSWLRRRSRGASSGPPSPASSPEPPTQRRPRSTRSLPRLLWGSSSGADGDGEGAALPRSDSAQSSGLVQRGRRITASQKVAPATEEQLSGALGGEAHARTPSGGLRRSSSSQLPAGAAPAGPQGDSARDETADASAKPRRAASEASSAPPGAGRDDRLELSGACETSGSLPSRVASQAPSLDSASLGAPPLVRRADDARGLLPAGANQGLLSNPPWVTKVRGGGDDAGSSQGAPSDRGDGWPRRRLSEVSASASFISADGASAATPRSDPTRPRTSSGGDAQAAPASSHQRGRFGGGGGGGSGFLARRGSTGSLPALSPPPPLAAGGSSRSPSGALAQAGGSSIVWGEDDEITLGRASPSPRAFPSSSDGAPWQTPAAAASLRRPSIMRRNSKLARSADDIRLLDEPPGPVPVRDLHAVTAYEARISNGTGSSPAPVGDAPAARRDAAKRSPAAGAFALPTVHSGKPAVERARGPEEAADWWAGGGRAGALLFRGAQQQQPLPPGML